MFIMLAVYVCTLGMALQSMHYVPKQCPLQSSKNLRTRGQVADAHYTIIYVYTASYCFVDLKIGCTSKHQAIHLKLLQRPA